MANEPENSVTDQISELRSQLSSLSSQLADRLGSATDKADNALSSAIFQAFCGSESDIVFTSTVYMEL